MTSARVPQCLLSFPPVVHPSYLEGDHSLATEILPGPPSLESIRQLSKKIEPKKVTAPSYLPLTDPGSTYIGFAGGMAAMAPDEIGPRRKRARMDKGLQVSHRAQRASARHIVDAPFFIDEASNSEPDAASSQPGPEDIVTFNDEDRSTSHSRSASVQPNGDAPDQSVSSKSTRKTDGKGKGKEKAAQIRVKEEPIALQLSDIPLAPTNEDHCSSCSSFGALVYCDSCPRAFHLWCLDPPMDPSIFPDGEESWYCPGCKIDQAPPPKPSHSFLSPLIDQLHNEIPTEFCLPEEIRTYFRDVGTGPGGMYIDNSSTKAIRIGRHGLGEERDPYRLKDNKGTPIICFHCGKSALPDDPSVGPSTKGPRHASTIISDAEHWKSIISCDFCPLHWHVDCLEPPLTSLPPLHRKWKCPNHASSSVPKLRIPKTALPPIDITYTHQRNNGNIEVINSETPTRSEDKIPIDEVLINGRKYRVPERIIVLDFWGKVKQHRSSRLRESDSVESSPLTSLSSLDDHPTPLQLDDRILDSDENSLQIAGLLCQLRSARPSSQHQSSPTNKQTQRRDHVRMVRRASDRSNSDFAATFIKNKQGSQGKEKDVLTHARPATQTKRNGINGARPSRSTRTMIPHTTSYYGQKTGKFASSLNGTQAIHDTKAKEFGSNLNSKHSTGLEALVARSTLSNEAMGSKPSTTPLKIRIPSRILQKQSSSSISAGDTGHVPSISSLQTRPRRSLRRQSSANGTGSECSLSTDRGYDGRS